MIFWTKVLHKTINILRPLPIYIQTLIAVKIWDFFLMSLRFQDKYLPLQNISQIADYITRIG